MTSQLHCDQKQE